MYHAPKSYTPQCPHRYLTFLLHAPCRTAHPTLLCITDNTTCTMHRTLYILLFLTPLIVQHRLDRTLCAIYRATYTTDHTLRSIHHTCILYTYISHHKSSYISRHTQLPYIHHHT